MKTTTAVFMAVLLTLAASYGYLLSQAPYLAIRAFFMTWAGGGNIFTLGSSAYPFQEICIFKVSEAATDGARVLDLVVGQQRNSTAFSGCGGTIQKCCPGYFTDSSTMLVFKSQSQISCEPVFVEMKPNAPAVRCVDSRRARDLTSDLIGN